jgi:dTDP-4-dehydrorhamnose reductase
MKLLVLGATGQVGLELGRIPIPAGWSLTALDRNRLDVIQRDAVFAALALERPDLVINAAAYTAVDRAENEPSAAFGANSEGPRNIAAACSDAGTPLIHLSTDYIFDGAKPGPYVEDDLPRPLGVYGRSKEAGERAVRDELAHHVIVRTAWIYSVHGRNFVKTMLRLIGEERTLRVVADQQGSPTSAADIAGALVTIAAQIASGRAHWGTFHFGGAGSTTWHGFAEAIVAQAAPWTGKTPSVEAISTAQYPTPAQRPLNSVLDCSKIGAAYGINPRPWSAGLAEILAELFASTPAVAAHSCELAGTATASRD